MLTLKLKFGRNEKNNYKHQLYKSALNRIMVQYLFKRLLSINHIVFVFYDCAKLDKFKFKSNPKSRYFTFHYPCPKSKRRCLLDLLSQQ